jgi:hypothetical protein
MRHQLHVSVQFCKHVIQATFLAQFLLWFGKYPVEICNKRYISSHSVHDTLKHATSSEFCGLPGNFCFNTIPASSKLKKTMANLTPESFLYVHCTMTMGINPAGTLHFILNRHQHADLWYTQNFSACTITVCTIWVLKIISLHSSWLFNSK